MMNVADPTPYPEINAVLHALLAAVRAALGRHFTGMYLYGSLASGDFNPDTSDIDFLVVTAGELPDEMIPALVELHARVPGGVSPWAMKLEGRYLPQHALRRYNPADPPRPCVHEGRFYLGVQESDWIIHRYTLREQGVALAGPALRTLIVSVGPDDLRRSTLGILREWWAPMLDDPARLRSSEYQAYAVLTMCRALHTLQHGTVVSKLVAARWAQQALGARWAPLIERAMAWRHDDPMDSCDETLAFIRYALQRAG